jgi:Ca2+-transporting ATPase
MHAISLDELFLKYESGPDGLTTAKAAELLKKGKNVLEGKKKDSAFSIFIRQFKNLIIWILIVALIVSVTVAYVEAEGSVHFVDFVEPFVIFVIILLMAFVGFFQEYKAERAIEALQKMASLKATVIRSNKEIEIDATEVVPGDLLLLEVGDKVAADGRLLTSINLETQEGMLTGESLPVEKTIKLMRDDTVLAERKNMVFMGTIVTKGRGSVFVTGTGMKTEMGKIASMIAEVEEKETPMQKKLQYLGKYLAWIILCVCLIVFGVGYLRGGTDLLGLFIIAVSLAVAAIPEGLPAVVTIGLALAVQQMAKRNALMRKLPSVETLGSTTIICTDKTGTLTKDEMTVVKMFVNDKIISIGGSGYNTTGEFTIGNRMVKPDSFSKLLTIGALCNDAHFEGRLLHGDPTEGALIVSAAKAGLKKDELEGKAVRVDELGFDSTRKRMTTQHKVGGKKVLYAKGAPESILDVCDTYLIDGKIKRLTKTSRKEILAKNDAFASKALRVLAFAYREGGKLEEYGMVFVGLQAMMDPPRLEAKEAIATCEAAGIKVIMITGDNELTAKAVGAELGLVGKSMHGSELDKVEDLGEVLEDVRIFSRVNPEHKLRIVEALKKQGEIVAMTGDGVNDAPALKTADIGVAMGITGTDVAKESADMILTDDNFASIVSAIEKGRGVYDNIKKFIYYLLSSNFGEVLTVFIAILLFSGSEGEILVPLLALHILWINLVTDGLPALALSADPYDHDIMSQLPRNPHEKIIPGVMLFKMLFVGGVMAAGTLLIFNYFIDNVEYARTMAFTTLVMFQLFNVLNARSSTKSLFTVGFFKNKWLWVALFISFGLQLVVLYTPLNTYFHTVPIAGLDWLYIVGVSSSVFFIMEAFKLIRGLFVKG